MIKLSAEQEARGVELWNALVVDALASSYSIRSEPVTEVIEKRFSCRNYLDKPIEEEKRQQLINLMSSLPPGPFGSPARFELVTATERDRDALKGLGTYGFIKGAAGFIIGAVGDSPKNLEDYGYSMERIILLATDIGLGTCWLGGSFHKSNFAQKISAGRGESVPAVASIGYIADKRRVLDTVVRRSAGSENRRPWEEMFFDGQFRVPISREDAGAHATPLEMVRLGPSASNKQPWRIVREGNTWHFYLQRTRGYGKRMLGFVKIADMQRLDMGIAMSHFELVAAELGLIGEWQVNEPEIEKPDKMTEYTASWVG